MGVDVWFFEFAYIYIVTLMGVDVGSDMQWDW